MNSEAGFTERLAERILGGAPPAVIGLDPRIEALPAAIAPGEAPAERIVAFYREVLPLVAEHAPVVKPNIAFFEAHGGAGYRAFEATCQLARDLGLLVLADVKRGDIGSTAEAYASAHFAQADAVTLSPYLGLDSVAPFLAGCRDGGKALFVLVRTSNPSAGDFQELSIGPDRTVADAVAAAVDAWGEEFADSHGYSAVGAVVGATRIELLERSRRAMPRAWLLLPGVGAQGAQVADLAAAFDERGLGALVNQSRGVLQCFQPDDRDWLALVEDQLERFAAELCAVSTAR